jgi:hypothetical protein
MAAKREQLTVCLEPPLREWVERMAQREDRSVSAQVRRLVAEAMRKETQDQQVAA